MRTETKSVTMVILMMTAVSMLGGCTPKDEPGWDLEGDQADMEMSDVGEQLDDGSSSVDMGTLDTSRPDQGTGSGLPASLVNQWNFVGSNDEPACCRDFDGDGRLDNVLGAFLHSFEMQEPVNTAVNDSLGSGQQALVFTFDGGSSLTDGTFEFAAPRASWAPGMSSIDDEGNEVVIGDDPSSFGLATVSSGELEAEGTFEMPFVIYGAPLWLPVRQATLTATIDRSRSGLGSGIALVDGRMSGAIAYDAFIERVNEFVADQCGCLGLGDTPLLSDDGTDCVPDLDGSACGDDVCSQIGPNCQYLTTISAAERDIDVDSDGLGDGISVGIEFTAAPATHAQ